MLTSENLVHPQCCVVFCYMNKLDLNFFKVAEENKVKCQNLLKSPGEYINIHDMIL